MYISSNIILFYLFLVVWVSREIDADQLLHGIHFCRYKTIAFLDSYWIRDRTTHIFNDNSSMSCPQTFSLIQYPLSRKIMAFQLHPGLWILPLCITKINRASTLFFSFAKPPKISYSRVPIPQWINWYHFNTAAWFLSLFCQYPVIYFPSHLFPRFATAHLYVWTGVPSYWHFFYIAALADTSALTFGTVWLSMNSSFRSGFHTVIPSKIQCFLLQS